MAAVPITVPGVGESISEGILSRWLKADGDDVREGEPLFELETDKATNLVPAPTAGKLRISVGEGETVAIGAAVGSIEPAAPPVSPGTPPTPQAEGAEAPIDGRAAPSPPPESLPTVPPPPSPKTAPMPLSPAVRRLVAEEGVDPTRIPPSGRGGRLTKGDVLTYLEQIRSPAASPELAPAAPDARRSSGPSGPPPAAPPSPPAEGRETRQRMSGLRQRIAQRLVEAQQTAAILTTFNEADLSRVQELRHRFKTAFQEKHGVSLGILSFFVKAAVEALKAFPAVNARIDGNEIVYHNYYDIGVAVSTEKGLVVPVLRDADQLSFAQIEQAVASLAMKARQGTISLDELRGGTFTITNGGIFGSLLSTPILNPPQSGILGMHAIKKRPVVVDDQIVIRPMMYLALSYDHRIIDGREAVSFLVRIKECIEEPERLLLAI